MEEKNESLKKKLQLNLPNNQSGKFDAKKKDEKIENLEKIIESTEKKIAI